MKIVCSKCGKICDSRRTYKIFWKDVDDWLLEHEFGLCFSCKILLDTWIHKKVPINNNKGSGEE